MGGCTRVREISEQRIKVAQEVPDRSQKSLEELGLIIGRQIEKSLISGTIYDMFAGSFSISVGIKIRAISATC